jgi:hypothetical protein
VEEDGIGGLTCFSCKEKRDRGKHRLWMVKNGMRAW